MGVSGVDTVQVEHAKTEDPSRQQISADENEEVAKRLANSGGSFTILQATPEDVDILARAEEEWMKFFSRPDAEKKTYAGKGGRGGPTDSLMLWGNGYSVYRAVRHQFHVVLGDADAQQWPSEEARRLALELAERMKRHCTGVLSKLAPEVERRRSETEAEDGDPSVLDIFWYPNADEENSVSGGNMSDHVDPGLLTIEAPSCVPGLDCFDGRDWVAVEQPEYATRGQLIMFCGEDLEISSGKVVRATRHRVSRPKAGSGGRISLIFELRKHGMGEGEGMGGA